MTPSTDTALDGAREHASVAHDRPLERGLAALAHPLSILAIGLLLLNDHVLKAELPSWWTGKLSDVAGLFFFPLLVTTIIAGLLRVSRSRRAERLPPDRIAAGVFVAVALWFAGIKTVGPMRDMTVAALRAVGIPNPTIVLDPTDLFALIAMMPAWLLWRRTDAPITAQRPARRRAAGWLAVAVGSLATMATSPEVVPAVENVEPVVIDGTVTWHAETQFGDRYISRDDGRTWSLEDASQSRETRSQSARESAGRRASPREEVCVPSEPDICFSIGEPGSMRIMVSEDAGQTWHRTDDPYRLRRAYWEREHDLQFLQLAVERVGPFDIAIESESEGFVVMVAMGSEGVMVRDRDGTWRRAAVGGAEPSSLNAINPGVGTVVTMAEAFVALLLAVGALGLAYAAGARGHASRRVGAITMTVAWALAMAAWLLRAGISRVLMAGLALSLVLWPVTLVAIAALIILAGALLVWRWRSRRDKAAPDPEPGGQGVLVRGLGIAAMVFAVTWLPFVGWADGSIPSYRSAAALALALGAAALVAGSVWLTRTRWKRPPADS